MAITICDTNRRGKHPVVDGIVPDMSRIRVQAVHATRRPGINAAELVVNEAVDDVAGQPVFCRIDTSLEIVAIRCVDSAQSSAVGCEPQAAGAIEKHSPNTGTGKALAVIKEGE